MFGWSTLRSTATSSCKESTSSCLSSPFLEMHFTATFVPSLLVARMTLEKAPVPSSLSSKLYFRANSEFASARSPPPPALEPCVGCRVSAFSLSCIRSAASVNVCTRVHAIEQTHHGDDVASMAWNLHTIGQAPSGLSSRSLSLDRRARARALLAPMRSAGRRARGAERSAAARRAKQLETAEATLWPLLRAPARWRYRRGERTPQPIAVLPDGYQC